MEKVLLAGKDQPVEILEKPTSVSLAPFRRRGWNFGRLNPTASGSRWPVKHSPAGWRRRRLGRAKAGESGG